MAGPEYYDAAKAHEYYLRTRELKGRKAASALKTTTKKEAWEYSKSEIAKKKKEETDQASTDKQAEVEAIRNSASQKRAAIAEKIKSIYAGLLADRKAKSSEITDDSSAQREKASKDRAEKIAQINKEVAQKIAGLPKIPKGASPKEAERIRAERAKELEQIRGESSTKREAVGAEYKSTLLDIRNQTSQKRETVSTDAANKRQAQQDSGRAEREQVTAQVKQSIDTARAAYEEKKAALISKYEAASQTEYDAIKNTVR